jgi:hypothetical protein
MITEKRLGMSILQDDASALSLPSAVQSIREQLSGELTRGEAAQKGKFQLNSKRRLLLHSKLQIVDMPFARKTRDYTTTILLWEWLG